MAGFWLRLRLLCKLFCAERSADSSKIFYLCLLYCLVLLVFVFVFHSCFIQQTFVDILFFVVDMFLISFFSFASQNLAFRTYLLYFFSRAQSKRKNLKFKKKIAFYKMKNKKIVEKPTNSGK